MAPPMNRLSTSRGAAGALEAALACALVVWVYCSGLGQVRFHHDESFWIVGSRIFEEFVQANFSSPDFEESYSTLTQPPLASYVIGLGRRAGGFDQTAHTKAWDGNKSPETNVIEGRAPSDRLLWWSRLPMAMLAAVAILLTFLLLRDWAGHLTAWIWILFAVTNGYFLLQLRRAMGEAVLMVCLMSAAMLCGKLLTTPLDETSQSMKRWMWRVALIGLTVGLAASAKLNGFSALGAGLAVIVFSLFGRPEQTGRRAALGVAAVLTLLLSTAGTFVALNPYLWPEPLARTGRMFEMRIVETRQFEQQFAQTRITSVEDRARTIAGRIFHDYASIGSRDRTGIAKLANALLCLGGIGWCLWLSARWLKTRAGQPTSLALVAIAATTGIPMLFTPLDWDRYYLIPAYFSSVFVAVALGALASRLLAFRGSSTATLRRL